MNTDSKTTEKSATEGTLRASVRQVVEFSLRGGDLLPGSLSAMLEGGRAHRARQESVQATAERPVRWQGSCCGIEADIQGRIDLLWENETPPCVEELKLCPAVGAPPEAAVPVHRMQAVCYGFMLCEELGLPGVRVRVSYVTEQGAVRACFEEELAQEAARAAFFGVLEPLARWEGMQREYRARRDASLQALAFPYPSYRPGQREMAAQVYTAIDRRRRLFACLPTGTGKSAATLFPALKALGLGKTQQIFCLTARGTARLSVLDAIGRMRRDGLVLRCAVITAREKCCPQEVIRCHPDHCPRAKGYYDRELPALTALCECTGWTDGDVAALCDEMQLCPFEFSLALSELCDVVICDYNYVFDPMVALKRIQGKPVTLLVDEAHNLPGRAREMLSAGLDSRELAGLRQETGRLYGRKSPLYRAMTSLLTPLRKGEETTADSLLPPLEALIDTMTAGFSLPQAEGYQPVFRELLQFRYALERRSNEKENYRTLIHYDGRERQWKLLCLDISRHLTQATRRMRGCVFFSGTLTPLAEMRRLLGGEEEDAVFALPSPFPPERRLTLRYGVDTRYQHREESAEEIARAILALYDGRAGKYIAYFPSHAYLALIGQRLSALRPGLPLNAQSRAMEDEAREAFLDRMRREEGPLLSLCVLGGVFSEGIDLPGDQLIGAAVVGVGLPQVNPEQEALREYYGQALGDGFAYAYRYPGIQKVLQAAGRVIRGPEDAGVVLLLDSRYADSAYARLLPEDCRPIPAGSDKEIRRLAQDFWQRYGIK